MSRRVLILGAGGLLGRALRRKRPAEEVASGGVEIFASDLADLPLEDPDRIARFIETNTIDCVLLLAAWTAVDACESDPERAFRVNGILPGRVASRTQDLGVPLTFISTDYVFDGEADRPYREYDPVRPLSVYARSKHYGECAVRAAAWDLRLVRTSGLYGPGGPDFVEAMLIRLPEEAR